MRRAVTTMESLQGLVFLVRRARFELWMSLGRKFLFLVALLLDNAGLGRVLEIAAGRDKGAPRNEDSDLCPRAVRILFEGIAGYFSEARGI
jgi:hypothetical protein